MADSDLERFLSVVKRATLGLDACEIADALWLATHLPAPPKLDEAIGDTARLGDTTSPPPNGLASKKETTSTASTSSSVVSGQRASAPAGVAAPVAGTVARGAGAVAVRVPGAPALPRPGAIGHALRPLRHRVVVTRERELDLAASIDRFAETRVWVPQWRRARGPWLEVALVVDVGRSMDVWRRTAVEAHRALERSGAFRSVTLWSLDTESGGRPVLRSGLRVEGAPRSAKELVDPIGHRAVLVLSDCVSRAWHDGSAAEALRAWAIAQPVAVAQVLPRAWWVRTGLRHHCDATLSARRPASPSARLAGGPTKAREDVGVPVVTLGAVGLHAWSWLVLGREGACTQGVLIEPVFQPFGETDPVAAEPSGADRVSAFRAVASKPAWRLALACAAAPVVTLPILRILRSAIVPDADTQHLAELLLGGLLREVDAGARLPDPDAVIYEVPEDVRRALAGEVSLATTAEVLRRVTGFIERERGASVDFRAVVRGDTAELQGDLPMGKVFASATPAVLRALGVASGPLSGSSQPPPEPPPLRVLVFCSPQLDRVGEFGAVLHAFGARAARLGWYLLIRKQSASDDALIMGVGASPSMTDAVGSLYALDGSPRGKLFDVVRDNMQSVALALAEFATADVAVFLTGPGEVAPPQDDLSHPSNLAHLADLANIPLVVAPHWNGPDRSATHHASLGKEAIRAVGEQWRSDPEALVEAIVRPVELQGRRDLSALPPPSAFSDEEVKLSRSICVIRDAEGNVRGTGVIVSQNVMMTSLDAAPSAPEEPWIAEFIAPFGAVCVRLSVPFKRSDPHTTFQDAGVGAWALQNASQRLFELARPPRWANAPPDGPLRLAWFSAALGRVVVRPALVRGDYVDVRRESKDDALRGAVLFDHDAPIACAIVIRDSPDGALRIVPSERLAKTIYSTSSPLNAALRSMFINKT